jgi:hypothetical protein
MITGGRTGQRGSTRRQVSFYRFTGGSSERNGTFSIPLTGHAHEFPIANLIDLQLRQLRNAKPGGIENFKNRPISQYERAAVLQRIQQVSDNSLGKGMREGPRSTGTSHLICRVEKDLPATGLVCKEHPNGRSLPGD